MRLPESGTVPQQATFPHSRKAVGDGCGGHQRAADDHKGGVVPRPVVLGLLMVRRVAVHRLGRRDQLPHHPQAEPGPGRDEAAALAGGNGRRRRRRQAAAATESSRCTAAGSQISLEVHLRRFQQPPKVHGEQRVPERPPLLAGRPGRRRADGQHDRRPLLASKCLDRREARK